MRLPPIVVGAGAGVLAAASLAYPVSASLDRLAQARDRRAELMAALAPGNDAPVPGLRAASGTAAAGALAARIKGAAARSGVLVEQADPVAEGPLARVRLRVSGTERTVIAFGDALERGTPLTRLATWRLERGGDAVRLSAEVAAPWR